jgi:hypothetical protein
MAEVSKGVSYTHAYKFYKAQCEMIDEKALDERAFKQVCYAFNKAAVANAIEGFHTQFPHKMGFLRVVRKKPEVERLAVDFQATKELGKTIFHDNKHSDGWYGEWSWGKMNILTPNMLHYSFKPTRALKKLITKAFRKEGNYYKRYMPLKIRKEPWKTQKEIKAARTAPMIKPPNSNCTYDL